MATQAHCAFCFETLSANFDKRQALDLAEVERLWEQYHATSNDTAQLENDEMTDVGTDDTSSSAKPAAISRLLNPAASAASSSSSLPSLGSGASSTASRSAVESAVTTPSSSNVSLATSGKPRNVSSGRHPLFITWNVISPRSRHKSLRGCIGTFEAQELEYGLRAYALTSALEDVRFPPIPASQLPQLSAHVTLLTNFSDPVRDPLDWTLGLHGIRISFTLHGRRYGSTYLPDVAKEQGWTKEEALVSLMRKAGWHGSSSSWQKVWKDGRGELVRYEGKQVGLDYAEWREWRDWVDQLVV